MPRFYAIHTKSIFRLVCMVYVATSVTDRLFFHRIYNDCERLFGCVQLYVSNSLCLILCVQICVCNCVCLRDAETTTKVWREPEICCIDKLD